MPSADHRNGVRSGMGSDRWRNDHTGPVAPSYSYGDLLRRRGSLLAYVQHDGGVSNDNRGVAVVAELDSGATNSVAVSSDERPDHAQAQLRSVLGAELSAGEVTQLLERCGWDVQRAVAAYFNDEPSASSTALAGDDAIARVGRVDTVRVGTKRLAQSEGGGQQKRKQRSVLTMWGRK